MNRRQQISANDDTEDDISSAATTDESNSGAGSGDGGEAGEEATVAEQMPGDERGGGEGAERSGADAVPACEWPLQCCCNCSLAQLPGGVAAAAEGGSGAGGAGGEGGGVEPMWVGAAAQTRERRGSLAAQRSTRLSLLRCGVGGRGSEVRGRAGVGGTAGGRGRDSSEEECKGLRAAEEGKERAGLPARYVAVHVKFDIETAAGGSSSSGGGGGVGSEECSYGGGEEEQALLRAVRGSEGESAAR